MLAAAMVLMVLAATGMAGCGDDGEAAPPPTTGAAPPDPTTEVLPRDETEQEVEEAYLAYWDMLDRLGQDPDPDDPEIEERATGTALDEVRAALTELRDRGNVTEPGPEYGHEVLEVTVSGETAEISACSVDDSVITDTAGDPVDESPAVTLRLNASLELTLDHWQVATVHIAESWPGVTDCDGT